MTSTTNTHTNTNPDTPLRPLFIIPARGGSKGIPHKNIKPFCGAPLAAYAIDTALRCAREAGVPSANVVLSTDDEDTAALGRKMGLSDAYRRPAELAADTTSARDVMLHAMDWAEAHGRDYDCVVYLQPTSPFRLPCDVDGALKAYREARHNGAEADMVVSVAPAPCNPYYDCFEQRADGSLHVSKGDGLLTRRQQAPPAWQYNGAVYVVRPAALRRHALGELPRRLPYPMPAERSLDLDTPLDWVIAEAVAPHIAGFKPLKATDLHILKPTDTPAHND